MQRGLVNNIKKELGVVHFRSNPFAINAVFTTGFLCT